MLITVFQNCGASNTNSSSGSTSLGNPGGMFAIPGSFTFAAPSGAPQGVITITNNSGALASNISVTVPPPYFSLVSGSDSCTGASLNSGSSCTFSVSYSNGSSSASQTGLAYVAYAVQQNGNLVPAPSVLVELYGPGFSGGGGSGTTSGGNPTQ